MLNGQEYRKVFKNSAQEANKHEICSGDFSCFVAIFITTYCCSSMEDIAPLVPGNYWYDYWYEWLYFVLNYRLFIFYSFYITCNFDPILTQFNLVIIVTK